MAAQFDCACWLGNDRVCGMVLYRDYRLSGAGCAAAVRRCGADYGRGGISVLTDRYDPVVPRSRLFRADLLLSVFVALAGDNPSADGRPPEYDGDIAEPSRNVTDAPSVRQGR